MKLITNAPKLGYLAHDVETVGRSFGTDLSVNIAFSGAQTARAWSAYIRKILYCSQILNWGILYSTQMFENAVLRVVTGHSSIHS
mmetsp:Transcript_31453/g.45886  ORF Transcript_31453/g.45886 Transcript_31453/m.45886 type:complete len:85 (+) Transcript_31453:499-753(+)